MKLELGPRIKILLLAAVVFSACTPKSKEGPYRVQIPWPDSAGNYSVQKVEVPTLTNPSTMQGGAASLRVQRSPRGPLPKADFIVDSDGTLIPSDFTTLQMAVVYAHMERLQSMETQLGFADLLPRPRSVTVEFPMQDEKGRNVSDNAFYYPSWDSLVLLPFSGRDIPISFNAGILAHEHFHAIFQHTIANSFPVALAPEFEVTWADQAPVDCERRMRSITAIQGKAKTPDQRALTMVLMRALNEGLADFWGWVYTRDEGFISRSLPLLTSQRKVSNELKQLPEKSFFEELAKVENVQSQVEVSYCLGTYFSRFMRRLADTEGAEAVAADLLNKLARARGKGLGEIGPKVLLSILFPTSGDLNSSRCGLVKSFMAPTADGDEFTKACADGAR